MFPGINGRTDAIDKYNKDYGKGAGQIIMFDEFIKKNLQNEYAKLIASGKLTYPQKILLPDTPARLAQGNYDPVDEIVIKKPLEFQGVPIWFNDSAKGVHLRYGNIEGDSRRPSPFNLDDKFIHAMIGGKTGFGKSVLLNALICSMCFEYGPWAIDLTLLDGKAADLKRFGTYKLPHVSSVGATTDTDYIISVLEEKHAEMHLIQAAITNTGANKLEELRALKGIYVPQHVIVIDEYQAIFTRAKKKLNHLIDMIDDFSRLGRSSGYHLILASQGVSSDIPKNTMDQIPIRSCLGASQSISDAILGNSAAKLIQQKGIILVNINPEGKSEADNVSLRVPFQPGPSDKGDQFTPQTRFLYSQGEHIEFVRELSFYDETKYIFENEYENYLAQFKDSEHKIYLGEPAFVLRDDEYSVTMKLDGSDLENIMVYNIKEAEVVRGLKQLYYNLRRNKNAMNIVRSGSSELINKIGFDDDNFVTAQIGAAIDPELTSIYDTIFLRKLLLDIDKKCKQRMVCNESGDANLKEFLGEDRMEYFTELNRSRAAYIGNALISDYIDILGLQSLYGQELKAAQNRYFMDTMEMYFDYGYESRFVDKSEFSRVFIWLLDTDKILYLGRMPKNSYIVKLTDAMLTASDVNVSFIISGKIIDDIRDTFGAIRWAILDQPSSKLISALKAGDEMPEYTAKCLSILYDKVNKTVQKYKKMAFEGESFA